MAAPWTSQQSAQVIERIRTIISKIKELNELATDECPIPFQALIQSPHGSATAFFVPAGTKKETLERSTRMLAANVTQIAESCISIGETVGAPAPALLDMVLGRAQGTIALSFDALARSHSNARVTDLRVQRPPTTFDEARSLVMDAVAHKQEGPVVERQLEEMPYFIGLHVEPDGQRKAIILEKGQPAVALTPRRVPHPFTPATNVVAFDWGPDISDLAAANLAHSIAFEVLRRWSLKESSPLWLTGGNKVEETAARCWPAVRMEFVALIPPAGGVTPGASILTIIEKFLASEK